jgi:hypothetical protein
MKRDFAFASPSFGVVAAGASGGSRAAGVGFVSSMG